MTYINFVCDIIKTAEVGMPIYTVDIAKKLKRNYNIQSMAKANAAVSVAFKRIIDKKIFPDLRRYQKGIYYHTDITPFGEVGINKERLIDDKYLASNTGYETGLSVLHRMGLTSQLPNERIIATNASKECARKDKKLNVVIRPPKTKITAANKMYLQILDILELLDKAPIDADNPYQIIGEHIKNNQLKYENLLCIADRYYGKNTVLQLAHTAGTEV